MVSSGYHLLPPVGCPDGVKSLMMSCWKQLPQERITFEEIVTQLEEAKSAAPEYTNPAYGLEEHVQFTNTMGNSNTEKESHSLLANTNGDITYEKPIQVTYAKLADVSHVDNQDNQHPQLQSDPLVQPKPSKEKYVVVLSDIKEESETGIG